MNYLENMGENLELLDLVKKSNVTTYSLRSIRDKNTAIKNLKGLRVELLRVSPSYMRENPCELVTTEVLNHAEAVETINLLGEEDTLNLEEMILLGSFFSEHIPYDPKLLADCVKAVGVREKSKYMRIYYDLLANGKKNLFNRLLTYPELAEAVLQECDLSEKKEFEHNLEKFYILDALPDSWDVNRESERIKTFIKILNCPGAMEIYGRAGRYAKNVFLPDVRDYSTAAEIVGKTMALLAEKLSKLDPNVMIQSDVYKRYFENASYIKFDQKLLSGYLKNLADMEPYDAGKSVFWRAGFLGVCTGNRYTKLVYQMAGKANEENLMELVYEAIVDHKKSFLRLMEDDLDLFLQIPYESILFVKDFRKLLNLNTLQKKDILTLLKKDKEIGWLYTYNTMDFRGLSGTYTFQELLAVCGQPEWIRKTYAKLDMRVDEKLRRIRQIFRFNSLKGNRDPAAIAAALSNESFEDYCTRRGIKDASKSDLFLLMELEQTDERVSSVANSAKTGQDVKTILRNRKSELFEMGLNAFKKAFTDLDTDSSWLKEQIEIPKEHQDAFTSFCLDGCASIVHDYYESNRGQQAENVLLIAKATIYGLLDEVKYKDLHKEIGYSITREQENAWRENITLMDGKVKTGEYTDFASCMNIGVLPERTCMNYRDGAYNECLLSTFDANKKVIYVMEEDEIIGRAILRLSKLSDEGDKDLHFEDVAEDTPENKENLVVFLERCYKNGFSGKKAAMIYRKLYDLAKRKAELLGAGLVLADDYKTVAELNGLAKKRSYIYVSESKNGKQYLDSLGGNCESGGYYVRGNFFFAS
jgi:hypothetical protein